MFKTFDTFGAILVEYVKILLAKFNLTKNVITYDKDEGANIHSYTIVFTFVVSCELLYATNEFKIDVGMKEVSLKDAQVVIKK